MKKITFILFILCGLKIYSQGNLYIYNYSDFDYHGLLVTLQPTGTNCTPSVVSHNNGHLIVEAISGAKFYTSFASTNSDISSWDVRATATGPVQNYLSPNSLLNNVYGNPTVNVWAYTRFTMFMPGTNVQVSSAGGAVGSGLNGCGVQDTFIDNGIVKATWFYISNGSTNDHYIIIENS